VRPRRHCCSHSRAGFGFAGRGCSQRRPSSRHSPTHQASQPQVSTVYVRRQQITWRSAATSRGSATSSNAQASAVGRAMTSTPRRRASRSSFAHDRQLSACAGADDQPRRRPRDRLVGRERRVAVPGPDIPSTGPFLRRRTRPRPRTTSWSNRRPSISSCPKETSLASIAASTVTMIARLGPNRQCRLPFGAVNQIASLGPRALAQVRRADRHGKGRGEASQAMRSPPAARASATIARAMDRVIARRLRSWYEPSGVAHPVPNRSPLAAAWAATLPRCSSESTIS